MRAEDNGEAELMHQPYWITSKAPYINRRWASGEPIAPRLHSMSSLSNLFHSPLTFSKRLPLRCGSFKRRHAGNQKSLHENTFQKPPRYNENVLFRLASLQQLLLNDILSLPSFNIYKRQRSEGTFGALPLFPKSFVQKKKNDQSLAQTERTANTQMTMSPAK